LEANDLEALPVAVFTRGFVVQIARLLGLDERKIADAYMKYFRANKR
jgi:cytoskeletal protein RodZ